MQPPHLLTIHFSQAALSNSSWGCVSARNPGPHELGGQRNAPLAHAGRTRASIPAERPWAWPAFQPRAAALPGETSRRRGSWHQSSLIKHTLRPGSPRLTCCNGLHLGPQPMPVRESWASTSGRVPPEEESPPLQMHIKQCLNRKA